MFSAPYPRTSFPHPPRRASPIPLSQPQPVSSSGQGLTSLLGFTGPGRTHMAAGKDCETTNASSIHYQKQKRRPFPPSPQQQPSEEPTGRPPRSAATDVSYPGKDGVGSRTRPGQHPGLARTLWVWRRSFAPQLLRPSPHRPFTYRCGVAASQALSPDTPRRGPSFQLHNRRRRRLTVTRRLFGAGACPTSAADRSRRWAALGRP